MGGTGGGGRGAGGRERGNTDTEWGGARTQGVGTQREELQGTARCVAGLNYPGVRQERHSQGLDAILGVLGMRRGQEGTFHVWSR